MNQVAEGYFASSCIHEVNENLKADIPIAETVYRILYHDCQSPPRNEKSFKKTKIDMKNKISVTIKGISLFVNPDELTACLESAKTSLIALREGRGRGNEFTGWLRLPDKTVSETEGIKTCAARLRSQAPVTVVVGIGGSYLGAKALTEALRILSGNRSIPLFLRATPSVRIIMLHCSGFLIGTCTI